MGLLEEFKEFLKEYKIVGLAVAFIISSAATTLVQSLVNDVIMPVISVILPEGDWQTAVLSIGSINIKWGMFLSALINFLIIAFVVFMVVKIMLKEEKVIKK
ncbi:MAG: large conductance mechanosensitive channel protein MscL [Candidatus Bilamarchaeaceae archaeon]